MTPYPVHARFTRLWTRWQTATWLFALLCVASCGGQGDQSAHDGMSRNAAARFLSQATFGPTDREIDRVVSIGIEKWIDDQFDRPTRLHRSYLEDRKAAIAPLGQGVVQNDFFESFWNSAISADDQLRQRVTFALSQIFVISFVDGALAEETRGVASYYDMLGSHAFGNFRTLLRDVALHPMMGIYLSSLRNQAETASRVPDENFAREVMQLFSIGLYELRPDGVVRLDALGAPIETYKSEDVAGLARVFTGWSWFAGEGASARTVESFVGTIAHPDRDWRPMQPYATSPADFHSLGEKRFLGRVIPAKTQGDPLGDLDIAIDTLFMHPNVGPFLARLLIQRLVTSNPSPAYIERVSAAFADNGSGVRGDMKAVVRAILRDREARAEPRTDARAGKLREPVLRLANFMRAFRSKSKSGRWLQIDNTDDPATSLGQTPMRSPSVFNFYRPDFVPNHPELGSAAIVAPEFQILSEVSVAGYVNYLQEWLTRRPQRDIEQDFAFEKGLASTPARLVEHLDTLLTAGGMSATLKSNLVAAVDARELPAAVKDSEGNITNAAAIDEALHDRVAIAILLTMASPSYLIQR